MEEVKRVIRYLQVEFASLWGVSIFIFIVYEAGILEEGALIGNPWLSYWFETASILLTLGLVPLSLKGFHRVLEKRIRPLPLLEALLSYHRWSIARMCVLALVAWGNLWVYYATLNTIGGLCALIGLVASLFCLPGRQHVVNDLNIVE